MHEWNTEIWKKEKKRKGPFFEQLKLAWLQRKELSYTLSLAEAPHRQLTEEAVKAKSIV